MMRDGMHQHTSIFQTDRNIMTVISVASSTVMPSSQFKARCFQALGAAERNEMRIIVTGPEPVGVLVVKFEAARH